MKVIHLICLLGLVVLTSVGCATVSRSNCGMSPGACGGACNLNPAPACNPVEIQGCGPVGCGNDKMVPMFHHNMVGTGEVYYGNGNMFGGRRPLKNLCGCIGCIRSNGLGHGCLFRGRNGGGQMGYYDDVQYTTRGPRDFFYNNPQPLGY